MYSMWGVIPQTLETKILRIIQYQKLEKLYSGSMGNPVNARQLVSDWWEIEQILK